MFHEPISRAERSHIIGLHDLGLSPRDIRDLADQPGARFPKRSSDGIIALLRRYGRKPHPSQRGPKSDGREETCESERHPGKTYQRRGGPGNECPECKRIRAAERRARVRVGLAERVETLRTLGPEAAEIADWIDGHVRVA